MAEGYLKHFSKGKAEIYSAGIEAHGVNPAAIETMKNDGLDISQQTSDAIDRYKDIAFDFVITVCDHAKENCPYLPGSAEVFHQNFPDPAKASGTETEIKQQFEKVRNRIKSYCEKFVKENL